MSKFVISTAKPTHTPSASNSHLSVSFAPKSVKEKEYMSWVCTRSNLAHAVSVVSRFMGDPRKDTTRIGPVTDCSKPSLTLQKPSLIVTPTADGR